MTAQHATQRTTKRTTERAATKPAPWATVAGMAGFWAFYNSLIYPSTVFGASDEGKAVFSTVASGALVVFGIASGITERVRPARNATFARLLAASGLACLAVFAVAALLVGTVDPAVSTSVLSAVYAASLGGFVALLGIGWARVNEGVARTGTDAVTPVTLSMLACTLVMVALSALFPWTSQEQFVPVYALLAVSCVLCVGMLRRQEDEAPRDRGSAEPGRTRREGAESLVMIATLGLYLLGSGMLRGVYSLNESPTGITGNLLHAGLLAVFLVASALCSAAWARGGRANRMPWVAFVLVCVVALYTTVLFSGTLDYISNELLLPTRPMTMLLIWGGLLAYAVGNRRPFGFVAGCVALPLFGLGRIAVYAVWSLLRGGDAPVQLDAAVLGAAFLLTVGVVAALALPRRPAAGEGALAGVAGSPLESADPGAARLSELNERYMLSEREAQVLALLVAGNSRAKIAEILVLSVNSVQTYAKSLYRKMGVHSRQELIDLVRDGQG